VRPLAESVGSKIVLPCDVEDVSTVDAVFAELKKQWGTIDFYVHAIGFSDKNELKGRFADTSRENFAHHGDFGVLLHRRRQARRGIDAERRLDDHADL
jgi:enoyl-[acyl-carrier-protein] reductase (NADH)